MLLDIEKCIVNDWEHVWDTQYTPDRVIGHKSMKILFLVPKFSVLTIFKKINDDFQKLDFQKINQQYFVIFYRKVKK